jgi:hypothetical protein
MELNRRKDLIRQRSLAAAALEDSELG